MCTRAKCLQIENHFEVHKPNLATMIYYQVHTDKKGVACWSQHTLVLPRESSLKVLTVRKESKQSVALTGV
jgi:hypothetical protein